MSGLLTLGAADRAAQRADGELTGEVPLVVDRAALVGRRAAVLGGEPAGLGEVLRGGLLTPQEVLGLLGREVRGPDRGQADADLGDGVAVQADRGAGRG